MNEINYFSLLHGKKLTDMGRAADMIWIILEEYNIDIIAETVVIKNGLQIIHSNDIYIETGAIDPKNQRPISVFDVKAKELLSSSTYIVTEVSMDAEENLTIRLSEGLTIRTTPKINYADGQMCNLFEDEKWRIFKHHAILPHMVASKEGVYWE